MSKPWSELTWEEKQVFTDEEDRPVVVRLPRRRKNWKAHFLKWRLTRLCLKKTSNAK